MLVTGLVLYHLTGTHGGLAGAWLGAAALSAGVCVEAVATRLLARDALAALRRLPAEAPSEAPSYGKILDFYTPLALTAWLTMAVQPLVTFFMGQALYSLESLAVLPVIGSLGFIFRAPGLAVQEVGIALLARGEVQRPPVRRFAGLLAVVLTGGLGLLAFTPLSGIWFERISGLSPALADFSRLPLMFQVAIPALVVVNSLQRAILVVARRTRPITLATAAEVAAVILLLVLGVRGLNLAGAVAASLALLGGRAVGVLLLWPAIRRR
jgi:progressive ankylosis protein